MFVRQIQRRAMCIQFLELIPKESTPFTGKPNGNICMHSLGARDMIDVLFCLSNIEGSPVSSIRMCECECVYVLHHSCSKKQLWKMCTLHNPHLSKQTQTPPPPPTLQTHAQTHRQSRMMRWCPQCSYIFVPPSVGNKAESRSSYKRINCSLATTTTESNRKLHTQ